MFAAQCRDTQASLADVGRLGPWVNSPCSSGSQLGCAHPALRSAKEGTARQSHPISLKDIRRGSKEYPLPYKERLHMASNWEHFSLWGHSWRRCETSGFSEGRLLVLPGSQASTTPSPFDNVTSDFLLSSVRSPPRGSTNQGATLSCCDIRTSSVS